MSKGYRNGAFALGLVVGGGVALNLFLWLDYRAQRQSNQAAYAQNDSDYSQIGTYWDGLIGTFISPSDTLAQWIMAAFTIAATIVLVFTLRSANNTNKAAINASKAALAANQIMRDQGAGYLIFEKVEVQARRSDVFIYATVKNIGQRPVRAGKIHGALKFVLPMNDKGGIPQFQFIRVQVNIFIGVVEAGQTSRGLSALSWSDIVDDYEIYSQRIYSTKDSGVDFDCRISWDDTIKPPSSERHILHPLRDFEVLEPNMGPITTLTVAYSGLSKDREESKT
ncbi:hypothetical protein [Sulfitobacter sp. CW3]|uniref:hypothetical protein n=1 Tax=Sulfitobacter sp. CW3 TaxID=2861965 RepID=UPI001C5E4332|nr:hypothetical protein [Sulfitobacter sp. CW3]MBW4962819.1 hypothetical protein [Sulfitobacter sp. CW3]